MHPHVELALGTIREYVSSGARPPLPDPLPGDMKLKAGVFVCIKINGELRGCIGTIEPSRSNLAEEIMDNAVSAAVSDGRFDPLEKKELENIEVSVDVLSAPEKVIGVGGLNPEVYGIIVSAGKKKGLLLPDLKGVDTPRQQIEICRRKGEIGEDEDIELYRFTVKRYR
ncbi:MAG: AmmeMemoRadiSam system protein A [bacterium]|nr:MAG: AmmeMemoRadiSam system protein A [bacterium]